MPKLKGVTVSLKLPFLGTINGIWEPDEVEQQAAWEMYVELITRVSLVELQPGEGLLHEALSSLYTLFDTTRKISSCDIAPTVFGQDQRALVAILSKCMHTVLRS